ncbi:hypothetical protein [Nitrosophilus alvini]|uniref:hypothetical protein n=1 Tax=Nitrosophilus alvini TaxID=2714855 RepID=UPI00190ABFDC|nr:hypothetical protein [Nitrosophilus alvini]
MDRIVKIVFFAAIFLVLPLVSNELKCKIEHERIYCTYFIDRSDNESGKTVIFHWYSPSGNDDRERVLEVPPYYGSVYDYRYLPGREKGEWKVEVIQTDTNKSATATFVIDSQNEEFFEE